jgi:hypothetical protein
MKAVISKDDFCQPHPTPQKMVFACMIEKLYLD